VAMICESLTAEDREFVRTAPKKLVPRCSKLFYEKMIDGNPGPIATVDYYVSLAIYSITKKSPHQIFHWIIRRIKVRMKRSEH